MSGSLPPVAHPRLAKLIRVLSIPIIVFWLLVGVLTGVFLPSLEETTTSHAQPQLPHDSPSTQAAVLSGKAFHETVYSSASTILFEAKGRALDDRDMKYHDELVKKLREDKESVQSVVDLWGDPVTRSGQQSADGRAATVTVYPAGDTGDAVSNRAIEKIRKDIEELKGRPEGLVVHVTSSAPLTTDSLDAADKSMGKLTIVTIILITIMLLVVYRSVTTALMPLIAVLIELGAARGVVAFVVEHRIIDISSYAANLLVALVLGTGTDYGIFLLGRYHEARQSGYSKEDSYYVAVKNVSHVIIGSGLAISGSTACLSFTYLSYFRTLGLPCAVGMVVTVCAALTLGPSLLTVGSKIGLLDPKSFKQNPTWRKAGVLIARWPVPLAVVGLVMAIIPLSGLVIYKVSYNDRDFEPATTDASLGYAAADRHFQKSQVSTDVLYLKADHDLRNSTDMIALDRVAKNVYRLPGISLVQSVTRPNGRPVEHGSLPYSMGSMGTKIGENIGFLRDRIADMGKISDTIGDIERTTTNMRDLTSKLAVGTHLSYAASKELKAITEDMRDHLGYVDDFFRPFRNFFYWETYCWELPWCWAGRSLFDTMDDIDKLADTAGELTRGIGIVDEVTPQMVTQLDSMITSTRTLRTLTLTTQSTLQSLIPQLDSMIEPMVDMAGAFDNAKNDDFFFLQPDALKTHDFKVSLKFFVTDDGKGTRMVIYHQGEAMSMEGIKQVREALTAAQESLKGTSISDVKLSITGSSASYRDVRDFSMNDTVIMMFATFTLVFLIVLLLLRALAAAIIVTSLVVLAYAGSFGLAVLIWQGMLGQHLHWLTMPISFIVLVAVGCDYNLLLLSRYKQELDEGSGYQTGLLRTMGSTGSVVIVAVVVFAVTMLALLSSDVLSIGQAGSTVCMGLLLDMVAVRLMMVLPIARKLGHWFWWPLKIKSPLEHKAEEEAAAREAGTPAGA